MGWETALDRLLMQQIHLAEKDASKSDLVQKQLRDYGELAADLPGMNFLFGYASILLGMELPAISTEQRSRRWHLFGRVRAFDRHNSMSRCIGTSVGIQ